jgi:hypothetical protein
MAAAGCSNEADAIDPSDRSFHVQAPRVLALGAEKAVQRGAGVRRPHKGFPDEECVKVCREHALHVFPRLDAAFRDQDSFAACGDACPKRKARLQPGLKGMKVSVVDA